VSVVQNITYPILPLADMTWPVEVCAVGPVHLDPGNNNILAVLRRHGSNRCSLDLVQDAVICRVGEFHEGRDLGFWV